MQIAAWESVRPTSVEYPRRVEEGRESEDLPRLYPGDKAVIAPVHPVVTVRKNYLACMKLRQESITLLQDPQPTWCKILPRTDLKDRFVVIERTTKEHTRRHIVANPDSVRAWLRFLFKNHTEFIRMEEEGELKLDNDALNVLQSQSELGEVVEDVQYESNDDGERSKETTGVHQPAMESGFSARDVYTFDRFPHLYIKNRDFLKIQQDGKILVIEDSTTERLPIYNVSATKAFPHLYPRGEKSPLDLSDYKLSRYLLKKQSLFAYKMSDSTYRWDYAEDSIHMMYQYARLVERTINAKAIWYIQETPDVAHLPLDEVSLSTPLIHTRIVISVATY